MRERVKSIFLKVMQMIKYEYFDVTADIGFYAYGINLNEAFENAGLALFNIISDTDDINPNVEFKFTVKSEDKVSLLYDYLEELLFYHETKFMLFSGFIIKIKKTKHHYHLDAIIKGEEINWDKHERKTEIKAITFHQMNVYENDYVKLKTIVDL